MGEEKKNSEEGRGTLDGILGREEDRRDVEENSIEMDKELDISNIRVISDLTPQLPEIGKIKIGTRVVKIVNGKDIKIPKKLDHFVVTTTLRNETDDLIPDKFVMGKIGDKCVELPIYLLYDDITLNLISYYGWFTQSKLHCIGNGRTGIEYLESGAVKRVVCDPDRCKSYGEKKCKPHGKLSVILPEANNVGGVYVYRTTSWNSIKQLLSSMALVKRAAGDLLAGIPLTLKLMKMQVKPKGQDKKRNTWVAHISFAGTVPELQDAGFGEMQRRVAMHTNMLEIESEAKKALAESVNEEEFVEQVEDKE